MDIIYDDCSLSNESVGLLMTYRCNLDCSYCYIKNKLNKDMTLETAKAILEPFLMKDDGWLDIIFVGGETLMATDVIRPLVEWAKNGGYKRHCRFFGSTNGTLLNDELKAWLTEYKDHLILSLSYDGIPSVQKNNRGCDDIDTDFFIRTWPGQSIQMTVNSNSVEHMAEGVIYLLEKGAIVHPNVAYEDSDWSDDKISEYAVQLRKLIDYYNSHDDLPMITQFVHNVHEYADNIQNPKAPVQV